MLTQDNTKVLQKESISPPDNTPELTDYYCEPKKIYRDIEDRPSMFGQLVNES